MMCSFHHWIFNYRGKWTKLRILQSRLFVHLVDSGLIQYIHSCYRLTLFMCLFMVTLHCNRWLSYNIYRQPYSSVPSYYERHAGLALQKHGNGLVCHNKKTLSWLGCLSFSPKLYGYHIHIWATSWSKFCSRKFSLTSLILSS